MLKNPRSGRVIIIKTMIPIRFKCEKCGQEHTWEIREEDIPKGQIFNFACLNVKRLPRVLKFRIDATKNANKFDKNYDRELITRLYGTQNVDDKIKRWNEINETRLWFVHDFDEFVEEILSAYVAGNFYPTVTACTTLAERLANLFIVRMRDLYDRNLLDSEHQKYIYDRDQSWQNHNKNMAVMDKWGLLSSQQKIHFAELNKIRRRSVHYQPTFDAKTDALVAITNLRNLIDSYFSQLIRKDILRVLEIPGEIWVRESKMQEPFVKAFVLPCCNDFASCGMFNRKDLYHEKDAIVGSFSENEFIEQRKQYTAHLSKDALDYEPIYKEYKLDGGRKISCRVV